MKRYLIIWFLVFVNFLYAKDLSVLVDKITTQSIGDFYLNGFYSSFCSSVSRRSGLELVDYKLFLDKKSEIDSSMKKTNMSNMDIMQVLNVDFIIKGNVDILDSDYAITLKLINVSTQKVENQIYKVYSVKMPQIIKDSTSSLLSALFFIKPKKFISNSSLVVLSRGDSKKIELKVEPIYAKKDVEYKYDNSVMRLKDEKIWFKGEGQTDLYIKSVYDSSVYTKIRVICKNTKIGKKYISPSINKKMICRISAFSLAFVGLGMGFYNNYQITKLQDDYDLSNNINAIEKINQDEKDYKFKRNLFYSIGVASATGLGLTFLF